MDISVVDTQLVQCVDSFMQLTTLMSTDFQQEYLVLRENILNTLLSLNQCRAELVSSLPLGVDALSPGVFCRARRWTSGKQDWVLLISALDTIASDIEERALWKVVWVRPQNCYEFVSSNLNFKASELQVYAPGNSNLTNIPIWSPESFGSWCENSITKLLNRKPIKVFVLNGMGYYVPAWLTTIQRQWNANESEGSSQYSAEVVIADTPPVIAAPPEPAPRSIVCILCSRQFMSQEQLDKHIQGSKLHAENLKKEREAKEMEKYQKADAHAAETNVESVNENLIKICPVSFFSFYPVEAAVCVVESSGSNGVDGASHSTNSSNTSSSGSNSYSTTSLPDPAAPPKHRFMDMLADSPHKPPPSSYSSDVCLEGLTSLVQQNYLLGQWEKHTKGMYL